MRKSRVVISVLLSPLLASACSTVGVARTHGAQQLPGHLVAPQPGAPQSLRTIGSRALGEKQKDGFVALWSSASTPAPPVLEKMSMSGGAPLAIIYRPPAGWAVSPPFTGTHGNIWLTLTRGPRLGEPGIEGGDPLPGTCAGEVVRVDPANGHASIVMKTPDDVAIGSAVPSPGGHRIAYLAGICSTSYFNMHLVVRNLLTGSQQTTYAGLTPCHSLSHPSWSPHGKRIVLTVAPSTLPPDSSFVPHGWCQSPGPGDIAVLSPVAVGRVRGVPSPDPSATPSSAGGPPASTVPAGTRVLAPAGCSYTGAVFDAQGIAAVKVCGPSPAPVPAPLGEASIVQFTRSFSTNSVLALEPNADGGASLATNAYGKVLIDEYEGPTYAGTARHPVQTGPFDWVWTFDGSALHLVAHYAAHATSIMGATWW